MYPINNLKLLNIYLILNLLLLDYGNDINNIREEETSSQWLHLFQR